MDVMFTCSLLYGESAEFGIKGQLMSSSCFEKDKAYYGYEEGQNNKCDCKELMRLDKSEDEQF